MRNYIYLFCAVILLGSCTSTKKSALSTPLYAPKINLNKLEADIEVDVNEKLYGDASASYFLWFRVGGDKKYLEDVAYSSNSKVAIESPLKLINPFHLLWKIFNSKAEDEVKGAAAYNAIDGKDVDVLVHPEYSVEVKDYLIFKKMYAEVKAFKGKFTGIEQVKDKNYLLDKNSRIENRTEREGTLIDKRKDGSSVDFDMNMDFSGDE